MVEALKKAQVKVCSCYMDSLAELNYEHEYEPHNCVGPSSLSCPSLFPPLRLPPLPAGRPAPPTLQAKLRERHSQRKTQQQGASSSQGAGALSAEERARRGAEADLVAEQLLRELALEEAGRAGKGGAAKKGERQMEGRISHTHGNPLILKGRRCFHSPAPVIKCLSLHLTNMCR